jgi:glucose-1-phosphate cytidylyltransferase
LKAVILAGGFGTRISEETGVRPKPMVEIGGKPILWHIMKIYTAYGITDFIVCLGYKGYFIKDYFANYALQCSNVTFDLRTNTSTIHQQSAEPWSVTLVETGEASMTGGRLRRVRDFIGDDAFCFTYGDGVSDVSVTELVALHREQGALVTLTAVQPPGRFGAMALGHDDVRVESFAEKPDGDGGWINGGFFVVEPAAIDYIADDFTAWEHEPLQQIARDGRLAAYKHRGYWQSMDTLHDKMALEAQWASGAPPWRVW